MMRHVANYVEAFKTEIFHAGAAFHWGVTSSPSAERGLEFRV